MKKSIMPIRRRIAAAGLIVALSLGRAAVVCGQDNLNTVSVRGTVWEVRQENGIPAFAITNAQHWYRLDQFSMQPRTNDLPKTFILSGRVRDRSAGFPAEQVPIFFGSTLHAARLAAITDVRGNFSFRVSLAEDNRHTPLEFGAPTNGSIYIGETSIYQSNSFDEKCSLIAGLVRGYSLSELVLSGADRSTQPNDSK